MTETGSSTTRTAPGTPELSIIIPCYNEVEAIPYTFPQLAAAFEQAGIALELVGVDNGSSDGTPNKLRELQATGLPIVPVTVATNRGYGFGLLAGIPHARAPWIGFLPADGQVDAEDVVRLFQALAPCGPKTLGKIRRRFRMDGLARKLVSIAYNGLVCCLYPRLGSIDVNGTPKIVHRSTLERMQLSSERWFLDPEILIKAQYMGVRVLEMNAFARMRGTGLSHVRASTCWEFLRQLARYRFSGYLRPWRRSLETERI